MNGSGERKIALENESWGGFMKSLFHAGLVAAVSLFVMLGATQGCSDSAGACSGSSCVCESGDTCSFECDASGGGCRQDCAAGDCTMNCAAGKCQQSVSQQGSGVATCKGGGCRQYCSPDAPKCTFSCEGGGCQQDCDGNANCAATCAGGGCTVSE